MPGQLIDLSRDGVPPELSVDHLVIGSGPAGATAAWELAQAGREVLILEEGGDRTGVALDQRDHLYDQLYMDRGGRSTSDLGISVLQGRALGGGSVINACDVVPAPDGVWRLWSRRFGLTEYSPERMAPYTHRALRDLHANLPLESQLNANNRLLRTGAEALGWRGELMLHNRVGCAGVGTCLIGCPVNAKKNARFVAIPAALAAGAQVLLRARVTRIDHHTAEQKVVRVSRLDPRGHRSVGEISIRARVVILAAGAVGSAALLLRSGIGNEHTGRHLSLQPQLPVTAWFRDQDVRAFRGIPQAFAITEFEELEHAERGWWGFRIEAIGGTPGIVASLLPRLGHAGKEQMSRYPQVAMCLCLVPDEPLGQVEVERSGRLRVHHTLTDGQRQRTREAAKAAARAWLAAGATEVVIPTVPEITVRTASEVDALDRLSLAPATAPLLSAHQQGGVRMAPSAREGAADPHGRVYGSRDVFVFDSALFPSSSSSHTMTPIITVSRMLSEALLAETPG